MMIIIQKQLKMSNHKDEPTNFITDSNSLKFKVRSLANTNNCGIVNAEIAVLLKYLSN